MSGIIMSAMALSLVVTDVYQGRINYVAQHTILGGAISILFFTLCNYGYEFLNWVALGIIPVYVIISWIIQLPWSPEVEPSEPEDSCE